MSVSGHTTTVRLWLVRSTEKAHLFSTAAQTHRVGDDGRKLWIPRSVIKSLVKFGEEKLGEWRECEVEIEAWFAEKEGIS